MYITRAPSILYPCSTRASPVNLPVHSTRAPCIIHHSTVHLCTSPVYHPCTYVLPPCSIRVPSIILPCSAREPTRAFYPCAYVLPPCSIRAYLAPYVFIPCNIRTLLYSPLVTSVLTFAPSVLPPCNIRTPYISTRTPPLKHPCITVTFIRTDARMR